jgi:hypothetical protein
VLGWDVSVLLPIRCVWLVLLLLLLSSSSLLLLLLLSMLLLLLLTVLLLLLLLTVLLLLLLMLLLLLTMLLLLLLMLSLMLSLTHLVLVIAEGERRGARSRAIEGSVTISDFASMLQVPCSVFPIHTQVRSSIHIRMPTSDPLEVIK